LRLYQEEEDGTLGFRWYNEHTDLWEPLAEIVKWFEEKRRREGTLCRWGPEELKNRAEWVGEIDSTKGEEVCTYKKALDVTCAESTPW
jgi:hypothetical protein